jgi:hypothetical protein
VSVCSGTGIVPLVAEKAANEKTGGRSPDQEDAGTPPGKATDVVQESVDASLVEALGDVGELPGGLAGVLRNVSGLLGAAVGQCGELIAPDSQPFRRLAGTLV